jgi:hypothetical protein
MQERNGEYRSSLVMLWFVGCGGVEVWQLAVARGSHFLMRSPLSIVCVDISDCAVVARILATRANVLVHCFIYYRRCANHLFIVFVGSMLESIMYLPCHARRNSSRYSDHSQSVTSSSRRSSIIFLLWAITKAIDDNEITSECPSPWIDYCSQAQGKPTAGTSKTTSSSGRLVGGTLRRFG